ncbi:MAG TPA: glycosyltransferase N-terminal domain-containing protein [Opitutaceae bacterium]|nr:glycosyltransferase N-terminal domain-containing protein [Opitutaceae bacterium]
MIWLYRLLYLPALLLAAPYYLHRMRKRGGYGPNFSHRFGGTPPLPPKRPGVRRIWLQAVSVGEMQAVGPLLEAFKADPTVEVYLTTTTSTGHQVARDRYQPLILALGYFPLDWWPFSARAWRRIRPELAILMEGERWPEHIRQAGRRGVPILSINSRLSDRSFRRMWRARFLAPSLIGGITCSLAVSPQDEERLRALGFPAARLRTLGNLKLDLTIPPLDAARRAALRRELGLDEGLVLLGSATWEGEELALVQALKAARGGGQRVSLLLVPRHAERREAVAAALAKTGLRFHLRSHGAAPREVDVAVGDTTGELRDFAQLADLVFCGKSLPPHDGGQSPVEAASLGKPLLFGPHMTNFREIARQLREGGAAREVLNESELIAACVELLADEPQRARLGAAALAWHAQNRGAVERTLAVIREVLAARRPGNGG